MITKEEMALILEREGLNQFIHARSYDVDRGVYETANGYYAMLFRIYPSPYLGKETESKLSAFLSLNLPKDSVIQFITYASRNISSKMKEYEKLHMDQKNIFKKANVDNPEFLKIMASSNSAWLKKFSNKTLFYKDGLDFYLRDFYNIVSIMIPRVDEKGFDYSDGELDSIFAQAKAGISDFQPTIFNQKDYVKLMREILNPSFPMWDPPMDTITEISSQISDINSAIELSNRGKIVFGKLTRDDGTRIELKTQVEVPKTFTTKVKNWANKFFGAKMKESDETVINPEWYSSVLTTKMFPETMSIWGMSDLMMDYYKSRPQTLIPIPFLASLTISIGDRDKLVEKLEEDAKWNTFQLSNAAGAAKFMPELKERAIEAKNIIALSTTEGEIPFKAMWSLCLFSKDEKQLDRYVGNVKKEFLKKNWILQEEELIQLPVLLYSLPLQYDQEFEKWSQRFNTLFRSNNTSITPLMTDARGFGQNVVQLVGRNGQLQGLDIFNKAATNKNFVTIAPTGSGKSYFMAYFFLNYLMVGTKIRIFDSGESYLSLCELVGGRYIRFDEKSNACFNFFTDISTDDNGDITEESIESIIPIIGMMAKQDLNKISNLSSTAQDDLDRAVISSYVSDAIKKAFEMEGYEAGMKEVLIALNLEYERQKRGLDGSRENFDVDKKLRDVIIALKPYGVEGGEYFSYLNGRKNINFSDNDFVVLEMKELETKGNFRNVALMTLAFSIENEFYFDDLRKKKILAIDEAWSLMEHPIVATFIEGLYRKARKFAGSIGTITQSLEDYFKNSSTEIMFRNAYWKFFLAPDPDELEKQRSDKKINLDDFTFNIMSSVKTKPGVFSEVMIKAGSNSTAVGMLISSRTLHWAFTTNGEERGYIKDVNEYYNLDNETVAASVIGYAEDNDVSIDEALSILKKMGKKSKEEVDKDKENKEDELLDLLG